MTRALTLIATLSLVTAGCGDDVTELVIVIDSDLSVPGEIDALRTVVTSPSGAVQTLPNTLDSAASLPRTLVLVHDGGALEPVRLAITAERAGASVVTAVREVAFVQGQSRRVTVFLTRDCVDVECPEGMTCAAGQCRGVRAEPCEYGEGECDAGMPPPDAGPEVEDGGRDAGGPDAGDPDAGPSDAGPTDGGDLDAGDPDAGPSDDAGPMDAGPSDDAGPMDAGPSDDAGPMDAGPSDDAGPGDAGPSDDAGGTDAGGTDAGGTDAGGTDAGGTDAGGTDAGPGCTLGTGICRRAGTLLPGDPITVRPCDPLPAGVEITWSLAGPSGPIPLGAPTDTAQTLRLLESGDSVFTATASAPAGCEATEVVTVARFVTQAETDRPGAVRRDLAARPGLAFVATDDGPWAVRTDGWHDLRTGATGSVVHDDLQAVAVLAGEPSFGADRAENVFSSATVTAGLAATFVDVPFPARRHTRAMAIPLGGAESGDAAPLLIGTRNGMVLWSPPADPVAVGPDWDAADDVAIGAREPATRGRLWGARFNKGARIRNISTSGGGAFAGGDEVNIGPDRVRAIEVDDRTAVERLYLCGDATLRTFDLDIDWSALTELPAPLSTAAGDCIDLAVGDDGDVWAAIGGGLSRYDSSGALVVTLDASHGAPVTGVRRVSAAWSGAVREVWLMTGPGDVARAEAPTGP